MIQYELFKNLKVGKKESNYHPRVKLSGTQSSKAIEEDVSMCCTATRGDIQLVLTSMAEKMIDYLSQGYAVRIKELGTFSITLKSDTPISDNNEAVNSHITIKNISFRPEKQILNRLRRKATFSFMRSLSSYTKPLNSKEENQLTDIIIIGHVKENGFITRNIMQNILHTTRYKTYKHIKRMIEEGKLINGNMIDSVPVYVLAGR